ncbi:MAG: SPFH domain-containing protein [Eubacterium sp.]|nr:SPFH domain-containing protein [Eubacterium sp.]
MGIVRAFAGALGGTFADQWKEIVTAGAFSEHTVVAPGLLRTTNKGRGVNYKGSDGVISNGSRIYVPENTAAIIFNQGGIEGIIAEPGGYVYNTGEQSIFSGGGFGSFVNTVVDRVSYGGQTASNVRAVFVNLREIRDIKFGTQGALMYNDRFYGADLEIMAHGCFSVRVFDPNLFIRYFVPANVSFYTFDDKKVKNQILTDFMQSFVVALNSLSKDYRISQLPAQANEITMTIANDMQNVGSWPSRFGFCITKVSIANIEFSPDSKELVREYSRNKMSLSAYEDISQRAANIGAQQQMAEGIKNKGLGSGAAGMFIGMNMSQNLPQNNTRQMSLDEQIESLKKLKELVDAGILSDEEFERKKKEIMGL